MDISITPGRTNVKHVINGTTHTKDVDLTDLIHQLNPHTSFDWGLLPPSTRYLASAGPNMIVAVELPAGKRDLKTYRYSTHSTAPIEIKNVALPAGLFIFVLRKTGSIYQMLATHAFGLENDRIIMMRDKLCHFPVPNVYTVDKTSEICWGGENRYDLKSLAGIEGMVRTFLTAPFNTDLFGTDKMSSQFPWDKIDNYLNIDSYFNFLAGEENFKSEWLKPMSGKFETFETALKHIISLYK